MRKWLIGGAALLVGIAWWVMESGSYYSYRGPIPLRGEQAESGPVASDQVAMETPPSRVLASSSDPPPEARLEMEGRVINALTLEPIAGARVWAQPTHGPAKEAEEEVETDDQGRWRIQEIHQRFWRDRLLWKRFFPDESDWMVLAEAPGYFRDAQSWLPIHAGDSKGPTLALYPQSTLYDLRVMDAQGRAVEGARVWVSDRVGRRQTKAVRSLLDGSFDLGETFTGTASGITLWAVKNNQIAFHQIYRTGKGLNLVPGCRVWGRLVDPLGRAIAHHSFNLGPRLLTTDGSGHFDEVVPREHRYLSVYIPEVGRLERWVKPEGAELDLGTVQLEPGKNIRGRLLDEADRPLAGMTVEIKAWISPEAHQQTATTDGGGWFQATWFFGDKVSQQVADPRFGQVYRNVDLEDTEEPVVWILKSGRPLTGVVLDERGQTVAGVVVDLTNPLGQRVFTDIMGRFRFESVPPDHYQLRVHEFGYQTFTENLEPWGDDGPPEITITLKPGAVLMGRALLANGKPALHAGLSLGDTYAVSDGEGRFRFVGVKPGLYPLRGGMYPGARYRNMPEMERTMSVRLRPGINNAQIVLVEPNSWRAFADSLLEDLFATKK